MQNSCEDAIKTQKKLGIRVLIVFLQKITFYAPCMFQKRISRLKRFPFPRETS